MAKSWRLAPGLVLVLGVAIVGCGKDDGGGGRDEQTTQTRSGALTTSLFDPYVAYPTGSTPEAVAIGDLDGDGRNDIAVLTSFHSDPANDVMVHVFLQSPDGTLQPRVKYPVSRGGSSIDIGDVNGDGRADVVVGDSGSSGIRVGVLLQNATGTLDALISCPTVNAFRVKVGDFNGDGRQDIAALGGLWGTGLDVFLQTDTGTLAPPVTYTAPHTMVNALGAGDINGDGRADVVVASGSNVSVLLQMMDGTLGAPTSYPTGSSWNTGGVAVGDTNGDARPDVVVGYGGNQPTSFVGRYLQNAQGTLDPLVSYASWDGPSALVLADVDADGRKDAIVTHNSWSRLGVYRQFPSGEFGGEERYTIPMSNSSQPQGLAVGDISGDGRPDAVIVDDSRGLLVLRHVQDDSLALTVTAPAGSGPFLTGVPLTIRWMTGDNTFALAGFDVSASFTSGTYTPIAGCTGLPGTARDCVWTPSSGSQISTVRVRVTARDGTGPIGFAETTFILEAPSIQVLVASREYVGIPTAIRWTHNLPPGDTVRIELSRNSGINFDLLAAAAPNNGSFPWTYVSPSEGYAILRITSNGPIPASGTSMFQIFNPWLTVTAPTAGANVYTSSLQVAWTTTVITASTVRIELSRDGGTTYETIAASWSNNGIFTGSISGPGSTNARIRVTTNGSVTASGTSAAFTLVASAITVTNPAPGATVFVGTPLTIGWSSTLPPGASIRVDLSRDGGSTYQFIAANLPNTGSFGWTVTGPVTSAAVVRLSVAGQPPLTATSGTFAIGTPSLTVTGPAPGTAVYAGMSQAITWSTNMPAASPVAIELSRDGGATYEVLASNAPNTGTFDWAVTGSATSAALVRVTITGPGSIAATSGTFSIVVPSLTVTSPGAGASFYAGSSLAITWATNLPAASPVTLELSRDGGGTHEVLATNAPNTGNFAWTVTGPSTSTALVRVTITSPGTMSATSGTFSIAVPSLTVTSPATGASFYAGTPLAITWATNLPAASPVTVELSRDGGGTYEVLATDAPNTGSFAWTVTGPSASNALVRVTVSGTPSLSATSGTFAIATPSLTVTSPASGAALYAGASQAITWSTNMPAASPVAIELSRDGGATYEVLASNAPNTGTFDWAVTGSATSAALVRVTITGPGSIAATSGTFSIAVPSLTVSSPTAGASVYAGTPLAITWATNLLAASPVTVELSRDGGGTYEVLATNAPNSGSFAWTVTGPSASNALVRVTVGGTPSLSATSGLFSITVPSLTVTSPGAGASFYAGTPLAITWATNLPAASPVTVELSRDGGGTYEVLATNAPNTGSFATIATGPSTGAALARVTVGGTPSLSASSGLFAIAVPSLTVTSPAAGAALYAGTPLTITWSTNMPGGSPVAIELSRDGGGTFETLAAAAPNTGSFDWIVSGPDSALASVRVTATDPVTVSGTSGTFAITTAALSVTGPTAGTLAYAGTAVTITWTSNLPAADPVSIELSRDGGATFTVLNGAVANSGSFVWTATGPDTTQARVRVTSHGAVSVSGVGAAFQILTGTIAVTSPAAGANWAIGTARTISWSNNLPAGTTVRVELSRNSGATWATLSSAASGGSLAWTATGPATSAAKVRVTANGGVPAVGTSAVFTIGNPAVTVTAPAAGASWTIGVAQAITWTSNLLPTATVKIELSRNGGSTYTTLASSAPNTGTFAWTATGPAGTNTKVRVSANGFTASSVSGTFSLVAASVRVTSPNTAVTWTVGTVHAITWTHNLGASAQFKIEVSRNGVFSTIVSAVTGGGATSGSYNWTVTSPKTTNAKIRVTWTGGSTVTDSSDVSFSIN